MVSAMPGRYAPARSARIPPSPEATAMSTAALPDPRPSGMFFGHPKGLFVLFLT